MIGFEGGGGGEGKSGRGMEGPQWPVMSSWLSCGFCLPLARERKKKKNGQEAEVNRVLKGYCFQKRKNI